ncbi:MAG: recombinase zinc beta ribbon domain-containing protein [bacterium]
MVCGCCGTPYRRCTWTAHGAKRIVWRCISRLDYGKKYCQESPIPGPSARCIWR